MKIETKVDKAKFEPFSIVIETKEEAKFIYGLLDGGSDESKENFMHYNREMDVAFFTELYKHLGEL